MSRRRKIAHFVDTETPGGAEVLIVELCRWLRDRGFEIEVFDFGCQWLIGRCRELGIPVLRPPGHADYKATLRLPLFNVRFARFLRARGVDLLHSHLFGPVTGASPATFVTRTPHVGTLHDAYTFDDRPGRVRLVQLACRLGTRVVPVSESIVHTLRRHGRFAADAFTVIPNGVAVERFSPDGAPPAHLGEPGREVSILHVGRLVPLKGQRELLRAFAKLRTPARLRIVGEGPERAALEREVAALGLEARVELLGFRDDVPALLRSADCFVLASHTEGLSCSILEAMAAGLPVVATDVGGNRELIEEGRTGLLAPARDPEALAERLERVAGDAALRRALGEAALRRAREHFSLEGMLARYLALYEELLGP